MSGKTVEHELSFYTTIVKWQGNGFVFEEKTVLRSLRTISAAGIRWIGIDGINIIEPCNSDLKKIVPLVRGWLDDLGLRVSSFHYASPTFASPDNGQEHVRDTMRRSLELFSAWQPRSFVVHAGWMETGGDNSAVAIESLFRDTVRKHGRETVRNVSEDMKPASDPVRMVNTGSGHGGAEQDGAYGKFCQELGIPAVSYGRSRMES